MSVIHRGFGVLGPFQQEKIQHCCANRPIDVFNNRLPLLLLLVLRQGRQNFPSVRVELLKSVQNQLLFGDFAVGLHHNGLAAGFPVQDYVLLGCYFELDVQVHYVEDQVELVEVNLELENCVGLP